MQLEWPDMGREYCCGKNGQIRVPFMHSLVILVHGGVPLCLHSESIMAELHHQFSHHNGSGCLEWQIMWQQSKRCAAFHNNEAAQAPCPRGKFTLELEVGLCKILLLWRRRSCVSSNLRCSAVIIVCVRRQKQKSMSWWAAVVSRGSSRRVKVSRLPDAGQMWSTAWLLVRSCQDHPLPKSGLIQGERWNKWRLVCITWVSFFFFQLW